MSAQVWSAQHTRADRLLQAGRWAEAVAAYDAAIATDPNASSSHLNRGHGLAHLGRWEEAAAAYRRVLDLTPEESSVHAQLGGALLKLGHLEASAEALRRAIAAEPDVAATHANLGHALSKLGQWEEAAAAYRHARTLDPSAAGVTENLANALLKANRWTEAVAEYEAAIEKQPDRASVHANLGHALRQLRRWEPARRAYERAIELEPDTAAFHESLGDTFRRMKHWDDAATAYGRALALGPRSTELARKAAAARSRADGPVAEGNLGNLLEVSVDLEVTSVCDAACSFCPRELMPDKKRFLSIDVVEQLARDITHDAVERVVLCGIGEPTLHPELERIVSLLAEAGTRVEMTTHGGRRFDADRFEALVGLGLAGLNFSLNANTAATHEKVMRLRDFERTIDTVRRVLDLRLRRYSHVPVHVSFVVCDENEHEVDDFVETWRPRRPSRIWLHPLNNRAGLLSPGLSPVSLDALSAKYVGDDLVLVDVFADLDAEQQLCKIAENMIFISADGQARLCAMDYRRVTNTGEVGSASLGEIHRSKLERYLRREMDEFCRTCDFCPPAVRERRSPDV